MTTQSWLIYLVFVFAATLSPGPAVLFIVTSTTLHGIRKSLFAAFGNIAGLFVIGVLTMSGLGTLLKTSEAVFNTFKLIGAAYLIYLGIKQFFSKSTGAQSNQASLNGYEVCNKQDSDTVSVKLFCQAFLVAISNPKAILFFTALFPQFIQTETSLIPQFLTLISVMMAASFSCLMLYALLASKVTDWFKSPNQPRLFQHFSGLLFVGFGILLATSTQEK